MATYGFNFDSLVNSDFSEGSSFTVNKWAGGSTATGIVVCDNLGVPLTVSSVEMIIASVKVGGGNLLSEEAKFSFELGIYTGSSFTPLTGWTGSTTVSEGNAQRTTCKVNRGTFTTDKDTRLAFKLTVSSNISSRAAEVVMSTFAISVEGSITQYTITANALPTEGGTVSGGGNYEYGSIRTLTAIPAVGYSFKGWADGGNENTRAIVVTGNATYTAVFEKILPPEITSVQMLYSNKQISADNKVPAGEYFRIVVGAVAHDS